MEIGALSFIKRYWPGIGAVIALAFVIVLMLFRPGAQRIEYVPDTAAVVNYEELLARFSEGDGLPVIFLCVAGIVLAVCVAAAVISPVSQQRAVGLAVAMVSIAGAFVLCLNTAASLNFSTGAAPATTLTHAQSLNFRGDTINLARGQITGMVNSAVWRENWLYVFRCHAAGTQCRLIFQFEYDPRADGDDAALVYDSADDAVRLTLAGVTLLTIDE